MQSTPIITIPNPHTEYVRWAAAHFLKKLGPVKQRDQIRLNLRAEVGENYHHAEIVLSFGELLDLAGSPQQGKNKAFIEALLSSLTAYDIDLGQAYQYQTNFDKQGYEQKSEEFPVSQLRQALRKLKTIRLPEEEKENWYVEPGVLHACLKAHFQRLVDEAGGDREQVDTTLTFLADLDRDNSTLVEDINNNDYVFTNYRVLDAEYNHITDLGEKNVEYVDFEQYQGEGASADMSLEDWLGITLNDLLDY